MKWLFTLSLFFPVISQAVTLTLNLNRYKDSAASTCDWSTAIGLIQAPLSSNGAALDFGDGSDGDCNFSGTITAREYKCRSLTVSGNARFTGTNRLIIRVLGNTTISGTLSVDGFPGNTGDSAAIIEGGVAGPGGFEGGKFDAFANDGLPVAGGGMGGVQGDQVTGLFGGGGGAGGTRTNAQPGFNGQDGTAAVNPDGIGGTASLSDINHIQADFESATSFIGGAGGGAGAIGFNNGNPDSLVASGGGGGGVVRIISRGDITITGLISADGGRGANSTNLNGAGGGGSGGAIWLQTAGTLTNDGTIRALGGTGGSSSATPSRGGAGGNGGEGRIRIDTLDGMLTGNNPNPIARGDAGSIAKIYDLDYSTAACVAQTTAIDTIGVTNSFRNFSLDETLNGGTISVEVQDSADGVSWSALTPLSSIANLSQRYLRFRVTLQSISAASSPELRNVSVEYDVEVKSDYVFKSDVSCGTTGDPDQKNEMFTSLGIGLLVGIMLLKRKPRTQS